MITFILIGAIILCLLLLVILYAIKVSKDTKKKKLAKQNNTAKPQYEQYDGQEQQRLKQESQQSLKDAQRLSLSSVEEEPEDLIVNEDDNLENHTFNEDEISYSLEQQPEQEPKSSKASPFIMEREAQDLYDEIVGQLEQEDQENLNDLERDELEPDVYPLGYAYMNDNGEINLLKGTKYAVKDGTDLDTNLYLVHSNVEEVEMILFDTLFSVKNGENLALADGDEIVPLNDFTLTIDDTEE